MDVILTKEAAEMTIEKIKNYVQTSQDFYPGCTGECAVVVGVEPLCRDARKALDMRRCEIKFDEARADIFHVSEQSFAGRRASKAYGGIFACAWNCRIGTNMSSYNPSRKQGVKNRRGCLGFDIMRKAGLFHKEKKWARYFVSVELFGVADRFNEYLASYGARILMTEMERRRVEQMEAEEAKHAHVEFRSFLQFAKGMSR